jgi:hypothetical protein
LVFVEILDGIFFHIVAESYATFWSGEEPDTATAH